MERIFINFVEHDDNELENLSASSYLVNDVKTVENHRSMLLR